MAAVSDVQFDGRLTNIAIQYGNTEMIADLVLPPTPVPKKEGVFKKYDKNQRFTLPPAIVGPKSVPNEVNWDVTEDSYACEDYGYQQYLSQEEVDNADAPIAPRSDTTEFVTNLMLLDREKRVADVVFNAANYDAGNQLDVAGAWNTLTTDALTQIEAGIDACFMPPNVMVMGIATWRKLSRNEKILAAVKGTLAPQKLKSAGGVASPAVNQEEMAGYLGLDAVLISRARINTAKEGQAASFTRVWDGPNATKGGAALLRVSAGSALRDVVWGASLDWKARRVMTNPTNRGAFGGEEIRVVESSVVKVIAKDVGYLFVDALLT